MTLRAPLLLALLAALACNSTSNSSAGPAVRSADAVQTAVPAPEPSIALPPIPAADPREKLIALGVREMLQVTHLRARAIDDAVASEASKRFIEGLDPQKLFLLAPQVTELERRASLLDDELKSGDLRTARLGAVLMEEQRKKVTTMVAQLLAKPFDFSIDESLETDRDKRTHAQDDAALRDLWRRHLKRQVLERVASMRRASEKEAEAEKKGETKKDEAKKDEAKKDEEHAKRRKDILPKTDPERHEKARKDLATNYEGRFKRLATPRPLEAVETFVNALGGVFGPHTHYLAPEEQANFEIQMSGSLEGIGAVLTESDHYIEIREVVPGGAAWRQGELDAGDLILSVQQDGEDPVDVIDMRLSDVVKMIRGPKGTVVTLSVRKSDDRVAAISITRDVIVVEASYARGALLDLGAGYDPVGYIFLPSFYGNTRARRGATPERNATDDVRALLQKFNQRKVASVVLDLRGNGGGLLSHANDITGLFIKDGPVVSVRGSDGRSQTLHDEDPKVYFDGHLIALVDRFSASASEILAGALQDYGRALVVGTGPTHGKGTVQTLVDLDRVLPHKGKSLGVLKLTTQQFFLVDGESTQQRGVQPDVLLPDPVSYVESGERFLDNAVPWTTIEPLRHEPWKRASWDRRVLAAASQSRQSAQAVFGTIKARGAHLEKRREDTVVPLEAQAFQAKREADEKALEALDPKLDEQPTHFRVEVIKYRPEKKAPKMSARVDTGERLKKWQESLARDPWIAESLHLIHDMAK